MTSASLSLEPLLTPQQLAELLNVQEDRLNEWRVEGKGPAYVKINRAVRYHPEDVRAYVNANRHMPIAATLPCRHTEQGGSNGA